MSFNARIIRPLIVLMALGLLAAALIPFAARGTRAGQQTIALAPGDTLTVTCDQSTLSGNIQGKQATLECAPLATPTPTAAPAGPVVTGFKGVSEGEVLKGRVAIEALVSGQGIARVEFVLQGPKPDTHTEKVAPYYFKGDNKGTPYGWDTTQSPDGDYIMTATAFNTAGQQGTNQVRFKIGNGQSQPTPTPTPAPGGSVGVCGESMDAWHPPVVNGCATGHEHGDAPPAWIAAAGYNVAFHGSFNTSAIENTTKHTAMKGFSTRLNGVDIYFRVHANSNPLDRSARFHSYQVWARDPGGNVSHWQGWYDTGDPVTARIPRRQGSETDQRPVMLVVDQTSWDQGIRCEQWYAFTAEWSWDFGWTICDSTTLFQPGENATAADQSTWKLTGSLGNSRRLEAAWYSFRNHPTGKFYTTQFGEIVSGPNDPRCTATTTKFGTSYQNVCLEQYIAPTMVDVKFPGNAEGKTFDATGAKIPN